MSNTFLMTIVVLVLALFAYELLARRRKKHSKEADAAVEEFLKEQLPTEDVSQLKRILIAENELLADHEWLIAYREDWMFWMPIVMGPFGKTIRLNGEEVDCVSHSVISDLKVSPERYQFKIEKGLTTKRMRIPKKGFFGEDQTPEVEDFIAYLQELEKVVAENKRHNG